jgi:hypothetical protein
VGPARRVGPDEGLDRQPDQRGRKNGLRACESRAINAAIRECGCGIKQKYTRAELEKPFLVVRVAFQPDMRDPAIKEMVTARRSAASRDVSAAARELPAHDVVDGEVRGREPALGRPRVDAAPPQATKPPRICRRRGAVKIANRTKSGRRTAASGRAISSSTATACLLDVRQAALRRRRAVQGVENAWVEIVTRRTQRRITSTSSRS